MRSFIVSSSLFVLFFAVAYGSVVPSLDSTSPSTDAGSSSVVRYGSGGGDRFDIFPLHNGRGSLTQQSRDFFLGRGKGSRSRDFRDRFHKFGLDGLFYYYGFGHGGHSFRHGRFDRHRRPFKFGKKGQPADEVDDFELDGDFEDFFGDEGMVENMDMEDMEETNDTGPDTKEDRPSTGAKKTKKDEKNNTPVEASNMAGNGENGRNGNTDGNSSKDGEEGEDGLLIGDFLSGGNGGDGGDGTNAR